MLGISPRSSPIRTPQRRKSMDRSRPAHRAPYDRQLPRIPTHGLPDPAHPAAADPDRITCAARNIHEAALHRPHLQQASKYRVQRPATSRDTGAVLLPAERRRTRIRAAKVHATKRAFAEHRFARRHHPESVRADIVHRVVDNARRRKSQIVL